MALEAELDLVAQQKDLTDHQLAVAQMLEAQLKGINEAIKEIRKEGDKNRASAEYIARKNADVKSAGRMDGDTKAVFLWATLATLLFLGFMFYVAHNVRQGDSEKAQIILSCTQQGGQWRSLGGQDDANKYDEVCVRPGAK